MEPSEAGAARAGRRACGSAGRAFRIRSRVAYHPDGRPSFIGICGVLRTADSPAPRAVQWLAAALAVAALAVASLAIFTVGRVAYPVNDAGDG